MQPAEVGMEATEDDVATTVEVALVMEALAKGNSNNDLRAKSPP